MAELGGVGGWIAGAVGAPLLWFAWRKVKNRILDAAVGWAMGRLTGLAKGEGIDDPDIKEFAKAVTLAFVHLAERKLPDGGLGPERKAWVRAMALRSLPWLKGHESDLDEFIEQAVAAMDTGLKTIEAQNKSGSTS